MAFAKQKKPLPASASFTQLDLFNPSVSSWLAPPYDAITTWLQEQGYRPRTITLYRTLWGRFIQWANQQNIAPLQSTPDDIRRFLISLSQSKRPQRERYQKVIARALDALAGEDQFKSNPARLASDYKKQSWRNAPDNLPMMFLSKDEQDTVRQTLQSTPAHLDYLPPTGLSWRYARAQALVTLMLGAGVKVSELTHLSVNCISFIGQRCSVDLSQYTSNLIQEGGADPRDSATHAFTGTSAGTNREILMQPWCTWAMRNWLLINQERCAKMKVPLGERLFTSTPGGTKLDASTVARIITSWSEMVKVDFTAQRLRNSFGANLIEAG